MALNRQRQENIMADASYLNEPRQNISNEENAVNHESDSDDHTNNLDLNIASNINTNQWQSSLDQARLIQ
jgi:hypothetical protein